tara:strand:+ start:231 stop:1160 length:930 start_codon:yes stop_codon:yes gene_type:complete
MKNTYKNFNAKSHTFRHRLEFKVFNYLKKWAERASKKQLEKGSLFLFCFLYGLRICRKIVRINLNLAFPKLTKKERKIIERSNYKWFARFCIDLLHMDSWKGRTSKIAIFKNLTTLDDALEEKKGVLLVSGHFGNWEIIPPALAELGYPITMYVGRQTNPLTNQLQNFTRSNFGIETIDKGKKATLQMGRALAAKKIIAMLTDQNDNKSDLFVNFFGKLASSSKGAAAFHLLRKSPIVLVTCPYVNDHYEISFRHLKFNLSGENEKDIRIISQEITSSLESVIKKFPEQYFWMHRRWRARPREDSKKIY